LPVVFLLAKLVIIAYIGNALMRKCLFSAYFCTLLCQNGMMFAKKNGWAAFFEGAFCLSEKVKHYGQNG
jgi:hypothetical protein